MPLRIRWTSKEYIGIALMLLGVCGLYQALFIFIAIYLLSIGNYLVIILIPLGTAIALYYGSLVIYESFAEVERREKLRTQFRKRRGKRSSIRKILNFPIVKPILILFVVFLLLFIIIYSISIEFLDNILAFVLTEFLSTFISLLIANYFERGYARVQRY